MLQSKVGETEARAQQALPADIAFDAINADEWLGAETRVLMNDGILNHEARPRKYLKPNSTESDVPVKGPLQACLKAAAVAISADIRGNDPCCEPAQEKSQRSDSRASVDPRTHQRTIGKAIRARA
jgi:hypothetical protein